ncbi:hypothetical protein F5141DRAFT_1083040, partial [Pisolithus sp. B1]
MTGGASFNVTLWGVISMISVYTVPSSRYAGSPRLASVRVCSLVCVALIVEVVVYL